MSEPVNIENLLSRAEQERAELERMAQFGGHVSLGQLATMAGLVVSLTKLHKQMRDEMQQSKKAAKR